MRYEAALKGIKTPGLTDKSGVLYYSTLRKIMEGRSVMDYERLRKIAITLSVRVSKITARAEEITEEDDLE